MPITPREEQSPWHVGWDEGLEHWRDDELDRLGMPEPLPGPEYAEGFACGRRTRREAELAHDMVRAKRSKNPRRGLAWWQSTPLNPLEIEHE